VTHRGHSLTCAPKWSIGRTMRGAQQRPRPFVAWSTSMTPSSLGPAAAVGRGAPHCSHAYQTTMSAPLIDAVCLSVCKPQILLLLVPSMLSPAFRATQCLPVSTASSITSHLPHHLPAVEKPPITQPKDTRFTLNPHSEITFARRQQTIHGGPGHAHSVSQIGDGCGPCPNDAQDREHFSMGHFWPLRLAPTHRRSFRDLSGRGCSTDSTDNNTCWISIPGIPHPPPLSAEQCIAPSRAGGRFVRAALNPLHPRCSPDLRLSIGPKPTCFLLCIAADVASHRQQDPER
jgi:hypothetical protein